MLTPTKNDQFHVFLNRLDHFPQVFGYVKERLILELRGMVRVPHVFPYPMDFNLL